MSCIPVVWQQADGSGPPEWVMLEMQGELQFKEHMHKKGIGMASTLQAFAGLEMGVLSPHAEHGPTRPDLRIGNLVIQGRLVPLAKPLLVLASRSLTAEAEQGSRADKEGMQSSDAAIGSPLSSSKRRREVEEDASPAGKKARDADSATPAAPAAASPAATTASATNSSAASASSSSASSPSSFPSSCLQSVAIIRHKYLFTHRPYAICDMGGGPAPAPQTAKPQAKS